MAFKVPLSEKLNKGLPETQRFSPNVLIAACPNLSLVIDLTNTYRYYDKKEFTSKSIQYEKICVPGKECPSSDLVHRFFEIVDKFLKSADTRPTDSLIGVHCTHGVNRTGYFICRYMIQRLGFDPVSALRAFQDGRGYPIERAHYIRDLKNCLGTEHTEVDGVKRKNSYRTAQSNSSHRTAQTSSYRAAHTNSNRTVQTNSSHRTARTSSYRAAGTKSSSTNSSQLRANNGSKMLPSGKGAMSYRNHHEGRNYTHSSSFNRGHTRTPVSNYNRGYSNASYKLEERKMGHKYRHTSSYNIEQRETPVCNSNGGANYIRNSGVHLSNLSYDWRTNNPYTQRNYTVPMVHTKYTVD